MANIRTVTLDRYRPLTSADLIKAERMEAQSLAAELSESGGLGWVVICLTGHWNNLNCTERLQLAWCWELAVVPTSVAVAA